MGSGRPGAGEGHRLAPGATATDTGAGRTSPAGLQEAIDGTGRPQSFELKGVTVQGQVAMSRSKAPVKSVLGYLPGGGRPDEFVVVGAHYDHLGRGGAGSLAPTSEEIHNGADDNASGTAAVMSLAEKFVYAGRRDRSIIFVLFTGEEEGLIGSEYFVNHSPVPLDKVIAANTWNAARAIKKQEELGHLSVGAVADVAVLRVEKGSFGFADQDGARLKGTERLRCELTIRDGKVVYDLNDMTGVDWDKLPRDYRSIGDRRWDGLTEGGGRGGQRGGQPDGRR